MASQNSTTKLSVIHGNTVAMININFNLSNSCFAKCQNGECPARLQNKKKIPKCRSIQQCENLCGLFQTLFANFEVVSELFPGYFVTSEGYSEANEDVCYGNSLHQSWMQITLIWKINFFTQFLKKILKSLMSIQVVACLVLEVIINQRI